MLWHIYTHFVSAKVNVSVYDEQTHNKVTISSLKCVIFLVTPFWDLSHTFAHFCIKGSLVNGDVIRKQNSSNEKKY